MISYKELKQALQEINYICSLTECEKCAMCVNEGNKTICALKAYTPNNWLDIIGNEKIEMFVKRGEQLGDE